MFVFIRRGMIISVIGILLLIVVALIFVSFEFGMIDLDFGIRQMLEQRMAEKSSVEEVEKIEEEDKNEEKTEEESEKTISVVAVEEKDLNITVKEESLPKKENLPFNRTINVYYNETVEEISLIRSNRRFVIGENIDNIGIDKINIEHLPIFLRGDLDDDEIYDQSLKLDSFRIKIHTDNSYYDGDEFEAIRIEKNEGIMNYTLDIEHGNSWDDLVGNNVFLFGKEYLIIEANYESEELILMESPYILLLDNNDYIRMNLFGKEINLSAKYIRDHSLSIDENGKDSRKLELGEMYSLDNFEIYIEDVFGTEEARIIISPSVVNISRDKLIYNDERVRNFDVLIEYDTEENFKEIQINYVHDEEYYIQANGNLTIPFFENMFFRLSGRKLDDGEDYWDFYLRAISYDVIVEEIEIQAANE